MNNISGTLITGNICAAKVESASPVEYRLAIKKDGTLVLQGAFFWQRGDNNYGHDWREIQTVVLNDND